MTSPSTHRTAAVSSTASSTSGRAAPRWLLLVEYAALFVGLPFALALDLVPVPIFPALWTFTLICLAVLLADRAFDRSRLWSVRDLRSRSTYVLLPLLLGAPLLTLITLLYAPERLFGFVSRQPLVWAVVMVLYPVLSVYPQGIVYRSFIFHRYRRLFPGRWGRILASAVAFSIVHVVLENWIAPLLTLAGGILFAWTYDRTRSGLVAAAQHAAFGCFLFTIGLGWYFYHGAVR